MSKTYLVHFRMYCEDGFFGVLSLSSFIALPFTLFSSPCNDAVLSFSGKSSAVHLIVDSSMVVLLL